MSKYDPLKDYLIKSQERVIRLSFAQIEGILENQLPQSAFRYNAWWSNEIDGNHVQSHSWMDAGYGTKDVDLNSLSVTFEKTN
tara:strand:+ start:574 stop:822 length:249 start_codon:yes stop_codon:yes gene_type:complete